MTTHTGTRTGRLPGKTINSVVDRWAATCWFSFVSYVRNRALYAYVVAHHEGADFCQWPRQGD